MQLRQYAAEAAFPRRRFEADTAVAAGLRNNREHGTGLAESRGHFRAPRPRLRRGPDEVP